MLHFSSLNNTAIIVSAIILWVLGATWYSPVLFAKPWMRILDLEKVDGRPKGMLLGMVASFFGDVILSFILATIIMWSNATGFVLGGVIGVLAWIGFIAAPLLPQGLYERKPFKYFAINGGYWLIGMFVVGGLLASWK